MNKSSGRIETIAKIGAGIGSVTLQGRRDAGGHWQFRTVTDETEAYVLLGEEPPEKTTLPRTKGRGRHQANSESTAMVSRINGEGSISLTLDVTGDQRAKVAASAAEDYWTLQECGGIWRAREVSNLRPSA